MAARVAGKPALARALAFLRCPVCTSTVTGRAADGDVVGDATQRQSTQGLAKIVCDSGHSFDIAKQGFVTLFGNKGRRTKGDTPAQVQHRMDFLGRGFFDPIAAELELTVRGLSLTRHNPRPVVLDCGAGTGFYTRKVMATLPPESLAIATEISAPAARRLARAHERCAAIVADTWQGLPLGDSSCDFVLVTFAPRNESEFARVLEPGGVLVMVWPGKDHLEPLRSAFGMLAVESQKDKRLLTALEPYFDISSANIQHVRYGISLERADAVNLAMMGPSGVHLGYERVTQEAADIPSSALNATVDVRVGVFPVRK